MARRILHLPSSAAIAILGEGWRLLVTPENPEPEDVMPDDPLGQLVLVGALLADDEVGGRTRSMLWSHMANVIARQRARGRKGVLPFDRYKED